MGKGQRSRLARADEVKEKKIAAKKKARRDAVVRVVSIISAIVIVIGLVSWIGYSIVDSTARSNGTYLKRDIAVESANFKVTNAQMLYSFQNYYSSFVSSNESYLSAYGLDTSKSLKTQNYPSASEDGSKMTWYDYFMDATKAQIEQTLVLAEGAKAAGKTLSDEDKTSIENNLKNIKAEDIVPGLTNEALKEFMEMAQLASNYQTELQEAIKPTDADLEKFYKDNKNDYLKVDYRMYSFSYAAAEEDSEEKPLTKEEAKKLADELAATGSADKYVAWLKDYFTNVVKPANVETELKATLSENFGYSESYVGIDFLFGNNKAGAIKVVHDESSECYKVFLLLKPAHRDEEATRTVRHILISPVEVEDTEDTAAVKKAKEDAKKKADKLLADWKAGKATEESFAALVHDNTDDTGSKENGGLYEEFGRGQMVAPFENWAYDAARKKGDTGIVETDYGYHIMYYIGSGSPAWKVTATTNYKNDKYTEQYEALSEKNTVTLNDKKIDKIASYLA